MQSPRLVVLGPALLTVGLVIGVLWFLTGSKAKPVVLPNLAPLTGPWTVNGLTLEMTPEECVSILGEPDKRMEGEPPVINAWEWHNPAFVRAYFRQAGEGEATINVVEGVIGTWLVDKTGKVVIHPATTELEIRALLPGAITAEVYEAGAWLAPTRKGAHITLYQDPLAYEFNRVEELAPTVRLSSMRPSAS